MKSNGNAFDPNERAPGEVIDMQKSSTGGVVIIRSVVTRYGEFTEHVHVADEHMSWLRDAVSAYLNPTEDSTDEVAVT